MSQVPLAPPPPTKDPNQDRWLYLLWKRISSSGQLLWSYLDFTGSNITDIETRNHEDLQNLNTTNYRHLTATERTDLLGATYVTVNHTGDSLTNERALAVGTGLNLTDGGAGSSITVGQVQFVGDSGTGGFIGAVPAPSSGDGDADNRKYLCADGLWRVVDVPIHNGLEALEGGINEGVFETSAFETTAFQQGVVQFYHLTQPDYNAIVNQSAILTTAIDATLDDDAYTCIVTASAKVITLPEAIASRIGRSWTIIQNCNGYVDITPDVTDVMLLPGGSDTIRLDQIGSTLTVKCVSATTWVIT